MADPFDSQRPGLDSPALNAAAVTPDDDTDLTTVARALYVGVSGDISIIPARGAAAVTLVAVPVGVLPIAAKRVRATGTSATDIVALW